MELGYILALAAAACHAVFSLSIKLSFGGKDLPVRVFLFWVNVGVGLICCAAWPWISLEKIDLAYIGYYIMPPTLTYLVGVYAMVAGFKHGQASVAGPLLGTKIFFAAAASSLVLGLHPKTQVWVMVALAVPAVGLITWQQHEAVSLRTVFRPSNLATLLAAACYGFCDAFMVRAVRVHGDAEVAKITVFVVLQTVIGLSSFVFLIGIPIRSLVKLDARTVRMMCWIVLINLMVLLLIFFALALADVAVVNILFSSRTMLIIPLAVFAEWALRKPIDQMTRKTFVVRLAGSLILIVAIIGSMLA